MFGILVFLVPVQPNPVILMNIFELVFSCVQDGSKKRQIRPHSAWLAPASTPEPEGVVLYSEERPNRITSQLLHTPADVCHSPSSGFSVGYCSAEAGPGQHQHGTTHRLLLLHHVSRMKNSLVNALLLSQIQMNALMTTTLTDSRSLRTSPGNIRWCQAAVKQVRATWSCVQSDICDFELSEYVLILSSGIQNRPEDASTSFHAQRSSRRSSFDEHDEYNS